MLVNCSLSWVDIVAVFCDTFGMGVNVTNTAIIVFRRSCHRSRKFDWHYKGEAVKVVRSAVILGMPFGDVGCVKPWTGRLYQSAWKAFFGLQKLLLHHDLYGPEVRLRMFDLRVKSTTLYGCQIWGPDFTVIDLKKGFKNPFQGLQLAFMRFVTGASKEC